MQRCIWVMLIVTALLGVARADEADDKARASAREHYAKANSYFDLGHYDDAIVEYEAAYQAKNDPALLYNIGQAHRLAGHAAPALRFYRAYLARRPDAPNRAEVGVKIATLERAVEEQRKTEHIPPDQPMQPGGRPTSATTTPTVTPAADSPATPDRRAGRTKKIVAEAVAGGGLALVAGGIACAVLAQNASDSITSADRIHAAYDPALYDRYRTDQALAATLITVGGVAIAGGVVLYVLGHRESRRATHVALGPTLSPLLSGLSASVH